MTNHEEICASTCCGKTPDPPIIRPACSPCCKGDVIVPGKSKKKDSKVKCFEEDLVSLPNLHDIYCMKQPHGKQPLDIIINSGKPKITCRNEVRLKQKEEDVNFVLRQMLQLYKPDEIMFAFNGGKDCTVVLDLLGRLFRYACLRAIDIPVLYVYSDDSFTEINEFVESCTTRYRIELFKYKGDMKQGLAKFLKEYKNVKACVMGLRSTDPYCENLKVMQFTDSDWPPLMRINPILDWTYCDVWNYILYYEIPYCPLYNEGYTSLGTKSNTVRNDLLKCKQPVCSKDAYFPAYELIDGSMERAGRVPYSAGGFRQPTDETTQDPTTS